MDWTLTQLRSKVRELTGRLSTSDLSNSDLDDKINDFYLYVLPDEIVLPELKTFYSLTATDGTGSYTLPSTVFKIEKPITVDDGDGDAVSELGFWEDKDAFFTEYPEDDSADEDQPADMLLYGNTIYLRPIPDAAYTVKMAAIQRPTALSADSDTVTNPKWGPVIAYGTAIQMFIDAKDVDGASDLSDIYQFHLNSVDRKNLLQLANLRSVPSF